VLYSRLRLVGEGVTDRRSILIDDVLSSGGHIQAAAAFLANRGVDVAGAICAGRAEDAVVGEDAFSMRIESLSDFPANLTRWQPRSQPAHVIPIAQQIIGIDLEQF
jgi:orotate phosphoribosyltransferase